MLFNKNILFIGCLLLGALTAFAQDFNNYQPLQSSGTIPSDFITPSSEKYRKDMEQIRQETNSSRTLKDKSEFALSSNFGIDQMLRGGYVLFNDPVSVYLQEVTDRLIKDSGERSLEGKVRVHAVRSNYVNAFATDRGTVFVTLGLLAQLENEAQLAFILAHELSHFREKHGIESYLNEKSIDRNDIGSALGRGNADDKILAKNRYSKEIEKEADRFGLEMYLKTNYSLENLDVVFDVLQFAHLPFDLVVFDKTILESTHYKIPKSLVPDSTKTIAPLDDDDEKSTHPSIESRRQATQTALLGKSNQDKKDYLVSESRFDMVQKIARFEMPMSYYHHGQYFEGLYNAYLLHTTDSASIYVKKAIAKGLYYAAKMKNEGDLTIDISDYEGEWQALAHMLKKMNKIELSVLATHYIWRLHKQYPEDSELTTMTEDIFTELADQTAFADFSAVPATPSLDTTVQTTFKPVVVTHSEEMPREGKTKKKSKYAKLKEQPATQEVVKDKVGTYWQFAFVDDVADPEFVKAYEAGDKELKRRKELETYYASAEGKKELKKDRKNGVKLGIKKVVVVNPFFYEIDTRKRHKGVNLAKSETGQNQFRDLIIDAQKKAGMNIVMLDNNHLKANQTDAFNDIQLLDEWCSQQLDYTDLSPTIGINQAQIDSIADKYGTDYFLWNGVVNIRKPAQFETFDMICWTMTLFLYTPVLVYKAVKPNYETVVVSVLFDVKTGRRQVLKFDNYDTKGSKQFLKGHLYDVFMQIQEKEK